jgi:hypothetical protein
VLCLGLAVCAGVASCATRTEAEAAVAASRIRLAELREIQANATAAGDTTRAEAARHEADKVEQSIRGVQTALAAHDEPPPPEVGLVAQLIPGGVGAVAGVIGGVAWRIRKARVLAAALKSLGEAHTLAAQQRDAAIAEAQAIRAKTEPSPHAPAT